MEAVETVPTTAVSVTTSGSLITAGSIVSLLVVIGVIALVGVVIGVTLYTMSLITNNTNAINKLSAEVENVSGGVSQSQFNALSNTVSLLSATVTQLNNTLSGQITTLQNDFTTLNGTVVTLVGNVGTLQTQVTTLNSNVGTINGQITTIGANINTLNSEVALITSSVAALQTGKVDSITSAGLLTTLAGDLLITPGITGAITFTNGVFTSPVTNYNGTSGAMTINTSGFYLFEFVLATKITDYNATPGPASIFPVDMTLTLSIVYGTSPFGLIYIQPFTYNRQSSDINLYSGFAGSAITWIDVPGSSLDIVLTIALSNVSMSGGSPNIKIEALSGTLTVIPR